MSVTQERELIETLQEIQAMYSRTQVKYAVSVMMRRRFSGMYGIKRTSCFYGLARDMLDDHRIDESWMPE